MKKCIFTLLREKKEQRRWKRQPGTYTTSKRTWWTFYVNNKNKNEEEDGKTVVEILPNHHMYEYLTSFWWCDIILFWQLAHVQTAFYGTTHTLHTNLPLALQPHIRILHTHTSTRRRRSDSYCFWANVELQLNESKMALGKIRKLPFFLLRALQK